MKYDPSDPMPGSNQDYSPELDEERRRKAHMDTAPKSRTDRDEEADRIRRLRGGGGLGGEV